MRLSYLLSALGLIMFFIGLVTLVPVAVALLYGDFNSVTPFVFAAFVAMILGFFIRKFICTKKRIENINDVRKSEALFIVASSWLIFGIISAIPYLFYGFSPIDSLFEAVSGITTTGATILTRFDYPRALFFWRALTQWLGGMGIIVLFIAILPQFAIGGRQMFYAEAPGPTEEKITPRIKQTASALWAVYIGLTALQAILLTIAGMNPFDAICNSFATLSAGGFSPNPQSTMGYNSNMINWIFISFMFFAGTSFALQYRIITKRNPSLLFKSEEFKLYAKVVIIISLLITAALVVNNNYDIFKALTDAFYQVSSLITSTGSSNVDYTKWDISAKVLLFTTMFTGSCAGSAGGGIKMVRLLLIFKYLKREVLKILHPSAVTNIKIDNMIISKEIVGQVISFSIFYILVFAAAAIIVTITEKNAVIGITGSIATLGDIGPGFGKVIGPMGNYASLQPLTKIVFIFNMWVGRLELIPFVVMFLPDFWTIKNE